MLKSLQEQKKTSVKEKLTKTVTLASPHLSKNKAKAFINTVSVRQPCEHNIMTTNEIISVPKHSSIQIECRVQASPFEDKTLIFEPHENPQWPEGLEFCDSLVSRILGAMPSCHSDVKRRVAIIF